MQPRRAICVRLHKRSLSLYDDREQQRTTTQLLLYTYVNIACVWAVRFERVCVSKSTYAMDTYPYTVHVLQGKDASMYHVALPAAGVIA